jgi:hypothetical protein
MTKHIHLHLVSDSTGETVSSAARAAISQFEGIQAQEHTWSLIRGASQMEKVFAALDENPGPVLYTLVNPELRAMLKKACRQRELPAIPVLVPILRELSNYLGEEASSLPGRQHELTEEYFSRVDAMNYTLAHDDGQITWDLDQADIVLVGVSRTSKSPTCVYLAHRGLKAANVPYVAGVPLPESLLKASRPMIMGLTINPDRLVEIRKSRLSSLEQQNHASTYTDMEKVVDEIESAKKLFRQQKWPIVNVTNRSVEETAATILQQFQRRLARLEPGQGES